MDTFQHDHHSQPIHEAQSFLILHTEEGKS